MYINLIKWIMNLFWCVKLHIVLVISRIECNHRNEFLCQCLLWRSNQSFGCCSIWIFIWWIYDKTLFVEIKNRTEFCVGIRNLASSSIFLLHFHMTCCLLPIWVLHSILKCLFVTFDNVNQNIPSTAIKGNENK